MFALYRPVETATSIVLQAQVIVIEELAQASDDLCRLELWAGDTFLQTDELIAARARFQRARLAHLFVSRLPA